MHTVLEAVNLEQYILKWLDLYRSQDAGWSGRWLRILLECRNSSMITREVGSLLQGLKTLDGAQEAAHVLECLYLEHDDSSGGIVNKRSQDTGRSVDGYA